MGETNGSCHPERSEGPWCSLAAATALAQARTKVPRFARDDKRVSAEVYLPARGINNSTGGFTPYTAEKLPWFTASPRRPRESIYSSDCPSATSLKVRTNLILISLPPSFKGTSCPRW